MDGMGTYKKAMYWLFFNQISNNSKASFGRYQFTNPNDYEAVQGYQVLSVSQNLSCPNWIYFWVQVLRLSLLILFFNQSLLAPEPILRNKAQRKALHCILSNVGKYKTRPILFNMRNQANAPDQYNRHGYGHKPLIAMIQQLQRNGLLTLKKG